MKLPLNYNELNPHERREVRKEYIKLQDNKCAYCGLDLYKEPEDIICKYDVNERLYPKNFFKYPVHLHHSHDSGLTIGAVHCYCNAVMWEYEKE